MPVTNSMRKDMMWTLQIVMSFWLAVTIAEKNCTSDDDCVINQFCLTPEGSCENYTICSGYNRAEAAKPAREASQCGDCLDGYYEKLVVNSTKKTNSCIKKVNSTSAESNLHETNTTIPYGMISISVLAFMACLYVAHVMPRCKWNTASVDTTATGRETASIPVFQITRELGISAANVPPVIRCKSQNINTGKCDELEEQNPVSTIQEYPINFPVDESRLLHARAFHPPYYVRRDPNYDPDTNETTFYPDDIVSESTVPSSASSGNTVPEQALASLTDETQDNMTNSALQRPGSPLPSTNQEGRGSDENNNDDASENLEVFRYNNTNENANDNTD